MVVVASSMRPLRSLGWMLAFPVSFVAVIGRPSPGVVMVRGRYGRIDGHPPRRSKETKTPASSFVTPALEPRSGDSLRRACSSARPTPGPHPPHGRAAAGYTCLGRFGARSRRNPTGPVGQLQGLRNGRPTWRETRRGPHRRGCGPARIRDRPGFSPGRSPRPGGRRCRAPRRSCRRRAASGDPRGCRSGSARSSASARRGPRG